MTREEFIRAATEKYGDKYDYAYVTERGVENNTNVAIKCTRHGMFYDTPYMVLNGITCGCFECYKEKWWDNGEKEL